MYRELNEFRFKGKERLISLFGKQMLTQKPLPDDLIIASVGNTGFLFFSFMVDHDYKVLDSRSVSLLRCRFRFRQIFVQIVFVKLLCLDIKIYKIQLR